jgi:hypothetical protein
MDRHIASHAVTVTERDTVLRASRHILPPIRGGGNVTRDRKCGEGRNRPRHRHVRVDSQRQAVRTTAGQPIPRLAARVTQRVFMPARYSGPPNSRTNPRPSYGLLAGLLFPCASRLSNMLDCSPHNPLCCNETHRCHHLSADQREGIYPNARRNGGPAFDGAPANRPGGMPGGGKNKNPGGILTSSLSFAAPARKLRSSVSGAALSQKVRSTPKNSGGPVLKNPGCGHG